MLQTGWDGRVEGAQWRREVFLTHLLRSAAAFCLRPGEQTPLSQCAESHASVQHSGERHANPAVVLATFHLFRGLAPFLLCQDTYFLKENAYFVFKLEGAAFSLSTPEHQHMHTLPHKQFLFCCLIAQSCLILRCHGL